MDSVYNLLRDKYKQKFKKQLSLFKNTKTFNELQTKLNLQNYDFIVSEPKYEDQVLSMVANTYLKRNPWFKLFGLSLDDGKTIFKQRCHFACKYGRMILAINKVNGNLEGGTYYNDLCDEVAAHTNLHVVCVYMEEMIDFLYKNIDQKIIPKEMYKISVSKIKTPTELKALYGKYIFGGTTFVPKNKKNIFITLLLMGIVVRLSCGYKHVMGEVVHKSMETMSKFAGSKTISAIKDIKNFRFKDGTDVHYHLAEYGKKYGVTAMQHLEKGLTIQLVYMIIPGHKTVIKLVENLINFKSNSRAKL
eukprot:372870_1